MLECGWWEGGLELSLLFLSLEMRNYKFLPRTGGPTLGWAPKTQRKGFSGNSRAELTGAGCVAFVHGGRPQTPCSEGRGGAQAPARGPRDFFQFLAVSPVVFSEQEATHTRKRASQPCAYVPDWPRIAELVEQVT